MPGSPRRRGRCLLPAIATVLLLGCKDDLSRPMAARTLHEHFRAVLPVTYDEKGVIVHEITTPDEHLREVRFTWEGDSTSNVYGAYLQRTDRGWSVRRYDAPLLDLMSAWLSRERLHPFEELLDALHNVSKAAAEFDVEHRNEEVARFRQGRPIPEFRLTREGIERMLETPLPDSIEYGVTPADLYTAPVVWVRLRADTTVVCAERHWLAPSSSLPIDFRWVDEGVTPTCRHGFSRIHAGTTGIKDAEEDIHEAGGALRAVTP